MATIPFESLNLALETTRGTPIAAPTKRLNLLGVLKPSQKLWQPQESHGRLSDGPTVSTFR